MAPSGRLPLRFDVLTLFPEVFEPFLESSMLGIAREKGRAAYYLHNIRDYSLDRHHKVDDRPYGGGPGMVMCCEPVYRCYEAVRGMDTEPGRLLLLTPQGRRFDHALADQLSHERRILLLCGRYEGFDERIRLGLPVEEVSLGDFVLSGGEAAAMAIIDAIVRLVPGVLGDEESAREDSFAQGWLEYPHYTRPPEYDGRKVPDVLLSGDHAAIARWRRAQAEERTRARRADLLKNIDSEPETHDA
ncbi:MAG: tRNA (guanosine(37)-N1)-methyltransferase TrmD [Candidatus Brocadiaceae bacterium]|nr:tRNA (guanosine(37)-N1)-methyltransferase TrmD [Candidatus Brocadiaceae bacterium]